MDSEKLNSNREVEIEPEENYVKVKETVIIQILQSLEGMKRKLHKVLKDK